MSGIRITNKNVEKLFTQCGKNHVKVNWTIFFRSLSHYEGIIIFIHAHRPYAFVVHRMDYSSKQICLLKAKHDQIIINTRTTKMSIEKIKKINVTDRYVFGWLVLCDMCSVSCRGNVRGIEFSRARIDQIVRARCIFFVLNALAGQRRTLCMNKIHFRFYRTIYRSAKYYAFVSTKNGNMYSTEITTLSPFHAACLESRLTSCALTDVCLNSHSWTWAK